MNEANFVSVIRNDGLLKYYPNCDDEYHIDSVQNYIYDFYRESNLWKMMDRTKIELLLDFLNGLGEIVYLHSPGYGLLCMPNFEDLTDEQIETLYIMFGEIEKTSIYVKEFNSDSNMFFCDEALKNTDVLDKYFERGKICAQCNEK